ncbi:MAG: hypothetical protein LBG71_03295 [Clostridiales Family XIII bacterium]|jgi:hypothetical protein|nr:hypothetical protein [Clostridiales Family XIII bacterium]
MKNTVIALLLVIIAVAFTQPLVETLNVVKEKVTLDAALKNACRAARHNALSEARLGDLDAKVEEDGFTEHLKKAFAETLDLVPTVSAGGQLRFTSPRGRWNEISLSVTQIHDESDAFDERGVTKTMLELETPYVFRTALLKKAAALTSKAFVIKGKYNFLSMDIN